MASSPVTGRAAWLLLLGALLGPGLGLGAAAPLGADDEDAAARDDHPSRLEQDLDRYCFRCHGETRPKAGLDLVATLDRGGEADPSRWEGVLEHLRAGTMPPRSARQPDDATRQRLIDAVQALLPPPPPEPGAPTLRRLTRVEFDRSLRDLLGVDFDSSASFPADAFAEGLQGIGDVQFVTPTLFQTYWEAVDEVLDRALAEGSALRSVLRAALDAEEESDAIATLSGTLLERAFRRPARGRELPRRLEVYHAARRAGATPAEGLRRVLQSLLLSPHFLFRVEAERRAVDPWLDDFELATRLSYFLWSSMPDARLMEAASLGLLRHPELRRAELRRLLGDARSRALSEGFAGQWLGFEEVQDITPDVRRFRGFDERLRHSAHEESVRFFDAIVREDRSVFRLIDSATTFLDERLAQHYGIPGVEGSQWREVPLPDRRRGGVLGMASVLMTTSSPLRTSPVVRGTWILERLLGSPPPPPPPDAGSLPEDDRQEDGLSLRQRLERHRAEERCAACHDHIDPLGIALENYDGIGRWREQDQERPVDARTTLADGTELQGPRELKDWLLTKKRDIVRTMTVKLFVKAVGRRPRTDEQDEVEAVVDAVMQDEGRFWTMVEGIVETKAFRQRGERETAPPPTGDASTEDGA